MFLRFNRQGRYKQIEVQNRQMVYQEIDDTRHTSGEEPLLLIGLHGHGSHPDQMRTLVDITPERPAVYIALRGFLPLDDGFTWMPFEFDGQTFEVDPVILPKALEDIGTFIEAMQASYGIPPERSYLIGYSLGAGMSLAFSLAHPQLIHGAAVLTGTLFEAVKPLAADDLAGKPIFIGYGTLDPLITTHDMEEAQHFLQSKAANVTYREYRVPHVVSAAERDDVRAWIMGNANL